MRIIYFDLDGTLTDPKPGITRSIGYALARLGRPVPTEDELVWCIGPPLLASLRKLTGTEALASQALLLYLERFADIGLFEHAVFPGIEGTLSALATSGPRMFIATSKPTLYAERIVAHFALKPCFEGGSARSSTASAPTRPTCYAMRSRSQMSIHAGRS